MRGGSGEIVRFRALLASRFWREPLHSSCITQHDAMLADNLNTNLHTLTPNTEHRTSKRPRYIYIAYTIDCSNTLFIIYTLHPFDPLRIEPLFFSATIFFYVFIYFFLIPIYKFYSILFTWSFFSSWIETCPLISAFSKMFMSNAFIIHLFLWFFPLPMRSSSLRITRRIS